MKETNLVTTFAKIDYSMLDRFSTALIFCFVFFNSCQGQTTKKQNIDTVQNVSENTAPNFSYTVDVPEDWITYDTVMQDGMRSRYFIAPTLLKSDSPSVNIKLVNMKGQNINQFTTEQMEYLISNMKGILPLDRDDIDLSLSKGQWITYKKEQNGITRDMINYIIPLDGFAYIITCGTKKGTMDKYRPTFDKIAKSLKG